jgi:hypothetical protein
MAASDCHVAEGRSRPENSCPGEIFHHRLSVGIQNVQKLARVAAGMKVNRDIELFSGGGGFLEQRGFTGFGLRGI